MNTLYICFRLFVLFSRLVLTGGVTGGGVLVRIRGIRRNGLGISRSLIVGSFARTVWGLFVLARTRGFWAGIFTFWHPFSQRVCIFRSRNH